VTSLTEVRVLNGRSLKELCAVAALLGSMTLAGSAAPVPQTANPPATDPARAKRLAWFGEAKYGLFIHWGLYAIPAGEWKGKRSLGLGEWIMNRSQIPVKEYEQLATKFNPVKFDPDAWVQLAQDAGMKYIVITSKHHDGFAMFASKVSRYNIVEATPYKRDVLKQLADACDYPLHIGITEAGALRTGTVKSAIGLGSLLWAGIGDTVRVSLSAEPEEEVRVGFELLKALNLRHRGVNIIACPSCARQGFNVIKTVEALEARLAHISTPMSLSIIGCVITQTH